MNQNICRYVPTSQHKCYGCHESIKFKSKFQDGRWSFIGIEVWHMNWDREIDKADKSHTRKGEKDVEDPHRFFYKNQRIKDEKRQKDIVIPVSLDFSQLFLFWTKRQTKSELIWLFHGLTNN